MDLDRLETGPTDGPAQPVTAVDPNALLAELRKLANETLDDLDDPVVSEDVSAGEAGLATLFLQLDDWVARGGFLPGAWQDSDE